MAKKIDDGQDHRVHTASDLERYSRLRHDDQWNAQRDLAAIQERAAKHARLPREKASIQRAGDGDLTRWPAGTTTTDLLAHYVPALHSELLRINKRLSPDKQMRMRLAVVAGTSEPGDYGLVGDTAITVSRLVDAPELRRALADSPDHPLVVIVDDAIYQDVIQPEVSHLDPRHYHRVEIHNDAKNFHRTAWITVPGRQTGRWDITPDRPPGADSQVAPRKQPNSGQGRTSGTATVKSILLNRWTLLTSALTTAGTLLAVAVACGQDSGSGNQSVAVSGTGNSVNQNSGTCGQVSNNSTCVVQLQEAVEQTAKSSPNDGEFKAKLAKEATADPAGLGPGPWPFVVVDTFIDGQDWGLFARTTNREFGQRLGTAANRSMVWADCVVESDFIPPGAARENDVGPKWLLVRWKPVDPTQRSVSEPNETQRAWMYSGHTEAQRQHPRLLMRERTRRRRVSPRVWRTQPCAGHSPA